MIFPPCHHLALIRILSLCFVSSRIGLPIRSLAASLAESMKNEVGEGGRLIQHDPARTARVHILRCDVPYLACKDEGKRN